MTIEEALTILDAALNQQRLSDIQERVFRHAWAEHTYAKIAEELRYDTNHIKHVGSQVWQLLSEAFGEEVTKRNIHSVLRRKVRQLGLAAPPDTMDLNMSAQHPVSSQQSVQNLKSNQNRTDWGEAIDVSVFYGRTEELATLEQWIITDHCRLVGLFGMGGIGKTTLAIRSAQLIQAEFDYLIWCSLHNAPLIAEVLANLIQFLSDQKETSYPDVDSAISRLIDYLHRHRCLLILDNAETILRSGECAGRYREGYEAYGELLRRVGEVPHRSCLVLTSREKPRELALLEGEMLPVRSLQLIGLREAEGRQIFQAKGSFSGSEDEWRILNQHYGGNPLALKMVAVGVQNFLDGSISKVVELLNQGTLVFDDIRDVLDRQFNRLSDLEKAIMYWLAISREPVLFQELQADLFPKVSRGQILENLASLGRRSLIEKATPMPIEKNSAGFTQQPVVMEYMTDRLIEQVYHEITTEEIRLLISHALIKAQAKEYIRKSQVRVILEPVADRLHSTFRSKKDIEYQLRQILLKLREEFSASPGYGGGNITNLLHQLNPEDQKSTLKALGMVEVR